MKRLFWLLMVMFAVGVVLAWSILENTSVSLIWAPQQITNAASSSAISLKGYERAHLLVTAALATDVDTLRIDVYKLASATATPTLSQTATITGTTSGIAELELVKDMSAPFVKIKLTPSATMSISALLVKYGYYTAPF